MIKVVLEGIQHPSLNQWSRWHWGKKRKVKREFEEEIMLKCNKYHRPGLTNAQVEIRYYFDDKRKRDKDNYTPKFIMDGLVKAGVIADDNASNVFVNWKLLYDKDNPRTEIYVKEVI